MIGIDTNVLVRYLTQDDKKQASRANRLIDTQLTASQPGFITLVTLVEVVWVLESSYSQPKENILEVLRSLLTIRQLVVERADVAYKALKYFTTSSADFSDALIFAINEAHGVEKIYTFDKMAKSLGMTLL